MSDKKFPNFLFYFFFTFSAIPPPSILLPLLIFVENLCIDLLEFIVACLLVVGSSFSSNSNIEVEETFFVGIEVFNVFNCIDLIPESFKKRN